jgi:integrase
VGAGKDPETGRYHQLSRSFRGSARNERDTVGEARSALSRWLDELQDAGGFQRRHTFGEAAERWLSELERLGRSADTMRGYRGMLKRTILPAFGNRRLDEITTADVGSFCTDLYVDQKSPRYVRLHHSVIRGVLAEAKRSGWLNHNQAIDARLPKQSRRQRPAFDPSLVPALIAAARAYSPGFGALVHLAAVSGARRGELCALRRGDVETDGVRIEATKTDTERFVVLAPADMGLLSEWMQYQADTIASFDMEVDNRTWLFSPSPAADRPWHRDAISHRWLKVRMEVPGAEAMRFHDLRGWASSVLLDAGIDESTAAARLGHSSSRTTRQHYARPITSGERRAAEILAEAAARVG